MTSSGGGEIDVSVKEIRLEAITVDEAMKRLQGLPFQQRLIFLAIPYSERERHTVGSCTSVFFLKKDPGVKA